MNLDNILDATIDSLADLPEIKPFPAGTYICSLVLSAKEINKKTSVEAKFTLISDELELASPTDVPPKIKDSTNILYMLVNNAGSPNEISQGQLKNLARSLREGGVEGSTLSEIVAATAEGVMVGVTFGQRTDKNSGTVRNTLVKLTAQA